MNPRSTKKEVQNAYLRLIAVLLLVVVGVVARATEPEIDWDKVDFKGLASKNVFGADDRKPVRTNQWPFRAVGKLVSNTGGCTGTLVGPSLVLTAAHCVQDSAGNLKALTFYPNQIDGRAATSAVALLTYRGTLDSSQTESDWAVVILNRRLGDTYGYMGVAKTTPSSIPGGIMVLGYSGNYLNGQTASACVGEKREELGGLIYHDCDTARGSSGGPVISTYDNGKTLLVVGINVAEKRDGEESQYFAYYHRDRANIAIPTTEAVEKIKELLAKGF